MTPKFCINCEHCLTFIVKHQGSVNYCSYPGFTDPVTGAIPTCDSERNESGSCGTDAVHFSLGYGTEGFPCFLHSAGTFFPLSDRADQFDDKSVSGSLAPIQQRIVELRSELYKLEAERLKSIRELSKQEKDANPVEEFINDKCKTGPYEEESIALLFERFRNWCTETGNKHLKRSIFFERLTRSTNTTAVKQRSVSGRRLIYVAGISLKDEDENQDSKKPVEEKPEVNSQRALTEAEVSK